MARVQSHRMIVSAGDESSTLGRKGNSVTGAVCSPDTCDEFATLSGRLPGFTTDLLQRQRTGFNRRRDCYVEQ